jgi:large subunit ribosomal protein L23
MPKALHLYDVIKRPVITEKSTEIADAHNQYVFEVDMRANKIQIADAVVRIFNVDVLKVNTMVMPAKRGLRMRRFYVRRSAWKKAVVTVPAGQRIPIFEV